MTDSASTPGEASGDVVVENAGDVVVENAEDVYVADRAGSVAVTQAEDVHVQASGADHRDVDRDYVVDSGADVHLSGVKDVRVHQHSIRGELSVRGAEDVYLAATANATVQTVQDVYVEPNAVAGGAVAASNAQDVYLEERAINNGEIRVANTGDVFVEPDAVGGGEVAVTGVQDVFLKQNAVSRGQVALENAEDVHLETQSVTGDVAVSNPEEVHLDGDPARQVTEEGVLSYGSREVVVVEDVEDVHLNDDAVAGEVAVADADDVVEDSGGWLF